VDELHLAACRFVVGDLNSDDLVDVATRALVRGIDSPALRQLAGLYPQDRREAGELFRVALGELAVRLPERDDALWVIVRSIAAAMIAGECAPNTGSRRIWCLQGEVVEEGDLRVFVGLASEWEDHPDYRAEIDAEMLVAAREMLDRPEPRRWIQLQAEPGRSSIVVQRPDTGRTHLAVGKLPVTAPLQQAITAWSDHLSEIFERPPIGPGGFDDQAHAEAFVAEGQHLVERIQDELGSDWHVVYMPEAIRPPGLRLRRDRHRRT
jgi:hypothetical protein